MYESLFRSPPTPNTPLIIMLHFSPSTTHRTSLAAPFPTLLRAMALSDFFSYSSSVPAGTISTSTKATESQEPSPCDADITTATFLIEPHHHQEQERGYEVDKYDGADKEDCNKIEETFTLRLDKMWEYAHGHVSDTLRNPKVVLGVGWHDESNVPIGEVDVQFRAVSLVKVLVW